MAVLVRADIVDICILLFLIIYARNSERFIKERKLFFQLAFGSLGHAFFGLFTEFTINAESKSGFIGFLNHVGPLCFFFCALFFCITFFKYIISQLLPANKSKAYMTIAYILCGICILTLIVLPIDYVEGKGTYYSGGIGVSVCYAVCSIMFVVSLILMIVSRNRLNRVFLMCILPTSFAGIVLILIQLFVKEFFSTESALMLVTLGCFAAVDNPAAHSEDRAYIDLDTHTRNRNSYDKDIEKLKENLESEKEKSSIIYVICDLNGLKNVNDNYGHLEGDRMITAAANILMEVMKHCENVYRIGGDEFAVLYRGVDFQTVEQELRDVEFACQVASGSLVVPLVISMGYAVHGMGETLDATISRAGKMMYANKEAYYMSKGLDRRGRQHAYTSICESYTKILKANLSTDGYRVVQMLAEEKSTEKGFSDRISAWMRDFGTNGYVHPDDLGSYLSQTNLNYLRDYFRSGKHVKSILYRRKYSDGKYRRVMMEITTVDTEYSDDHQIVFVYVKSIDPEED